MEEKLKKIVEDSQRILVTTHFSPDPDAVSSLLITGTTLASNYPDKKIKMVAEDKPARDISFLSSYNEISYEPLLGAIEEFKPGLAVMLDANNFDRCSRNDAEAVKAYLQSNGVKTAIIDHHEEIGKDETDVFINNLAPASAQEVYRVLFQELGLSKPEGYAQTTLLGIISDTYRFLYENPLQRETFSIVSDLLDAGASIEKLENRLDRYTKDQMAAFSNLAKNITSSSKGYNFTFVDDAFSKEQQNTNAAAHIKMACEIFTSEFVRNFENSQWGFVVYPEFLGASMTYSVSFRSVGGVKDVSKFAHALGGGGHKQAAGAKKIAATNVHEAVSRVEQVIAELD